MATIIRRNKADQSHLHLFKAAFFISSNVFFGRYLLLVELRIRKSNIDGQMCSATLVAFARSAETLTPQSLKIFPLSRLERRAVGIIGGDLYAASRVSHQFPRE